jgi:folate-binding protein YgfZ
VTAFLVDRTSRLRMTFTGEKAKESLGGLVTNDVVALTPGHGHRAVALTAKGRVIAMVRVFDRGADLLLDCEPESAEGFVSMIRKYVNPRTAKFAVITDATACLGVHGHDAAAKLAPLVGMDAAALSALPPMGIVTSPDGAFDVIRSTELSVPGFDVVGSREVIATLRAALEQAGVHEIADAEVEIARVELGLPRYGVDMDAETIPQEANLDTLGAISFTKGCYTGQEVVARIHFRGHVNKHLRFLSTAEPLTRGAVVLDATGKEVGDVRSAVVSPKRGPIALAMVRREVEPGSEVQVRDGDRTITARVEAIA